MSRKHNPRHKAPVNHPAPPVAQPPRPIVSLAREGFKPITLDQLGLTKNEMKILAGRARSQFPPDENSNTP